MTAPTNQLDGAMMKDEQRELIALAARRLHDHAYYNIATALRALLAAAPAAIDKDALRTLALSIMGRSPKHEENIVGAMNLIRNAMLAASPAAPSVAQDERGAFETWLQKVGGNERTHIANVAAWAGWQARAASPSANVATAQYDPDERLGTGGHAAMLLLAERCGISKDTTNAAVIRFALACRDDSAPAVLAANVAQGAEAIYQARENLRSDAWKDCSKDAHDHMAKYPACFEVRTVYTAPQPTQTERAVTVEDLADELENMLFDLKNGHDVDSNEYARVIVARLNAAQSASGDKGN